MSVSTPSEPQAHLPVMLAEVIEALALSKGDICVDGTFGAGGYSRALLEAGAIVHGFDRDPDVWPIAREFEARYPEQFFFHPHPFAEMQQALASKNIVRLDAIVLDIGISSMQVDQAERGFSFRQDGPLDMRMGQSGMSAAEFLNHAEQEEIANIIYQYGEEKESRKIAAAIVAARPLTRTAQLRDVIHRIKRYKHWMKRDPATKTFQAIRIYINSELEQLEQALKSSLYLLSPGGRLVVVSFHSLEDRIVKSFIRSHSKPASQGSRHLPQPDKDTVKQYFNKANITIKPSEEESSRNGRARSAILRQAVRNAQIYKGDE